MIFAVTPMYVLYGKLKALKWKLKELNRDECCDLLMKVSEAKTFLEHLQRSMLSGGNEMLGATEKEMVSKYYH